MPAGRPTDYTREIAVSVCEMIAAGSTMQDACKKHGLAAGVVYGWLRAQEEFADMHARAVADRSELLAEEIISLSDKIEGETDRAKIEATRLRVDARKWVAARLLPNKYGDRSSLQVSGDLNLAAAVKDAAKLLKREPASE